jgi:hypothetical protein
MTGVRLPVHFANLVLANCLFRSPRLPRTPTLCAYRFVYLLRDRAKKTWRKSRH